MSTAHSFLNGVRVGFALTGSFCTFDIAYTCMTDLVARGAQVQPLLSPAAAATQTRFNTPDEVFATLQTITGRAPFTTLTEAEPIGPKKLLDVLLILPATGNTLAKLAAGIADTAVTMAAKSHLRNDRPVVLAVSSNDALSNGAKNIGALLNARNIFFVPFGQDAPEEKPRSAVFHAGQVLPTLEAALRGQQVQPILRSKE